MHGAREKCIYDFGVKARRKETTRWEDNTEMDLTEIVWGGMDRINLVVNVRKFLSNWWLLKV
jgi:hypothetical protein